MIKLIEIIKHIILGIIQGFTEPLPISSSGHVYILRSILNVGELTDLNFEIIVNFGSLIAILLIYYKDIKKLIINFFKYFKVKNEETKNDFKYCILIILGVIPIGIVGFLFKDQIENFLNSTKIIGISFLITALFLYLVRNIKGKKNDNDLTWKDALIIGLVQIIAVIPGISRSGSTLIAALFCNVKRDSALKYSFMLYIPISVGTTLLGIKDLITMPNIHEMMLPYGLGFIASLIVSFFTLRWFMDVVKKGKFIYFSIYCLILGLAILLFL